MADIFLSYTRGDAAKVRELAAALEERGFSVFWDTAVLPGQQWRDVIHDELTTAACVIVVWSQGSTRSRWVLEEASEALEAGKLLPVLLDDSLPPFGFRGVEAANLGGWTPGSANLEFDNLVDAVRRIVGEGEPIEDEATSDQATEDGAIDESATEDDATADAAVEIEATLDDATEVTSRTEPGDSVTPATEHTVLSSTEAVDEPPDTSAAADTTPRVMGEERLTGTDAVAEPPSREDPARVPQDDERERVPPDDERERVPPDDEIVRTSSPPPATATRNELRPTSTPAAEVETAEDRRGIDGLLARFGTGGILAMGAAVVLIVVVGISLAGGGGEDDPPTTTTTGGGTAATTTIAEQPETAVIDSDTVTAFRASAAPVIDGQLVEWAVPEAYRLRTEVFRAGAVDNRLGADSPGIVLAQFDDSALYLAVISDDDVYSQLNTGNQIWRGDALDINLTTAASGSISERPDGDDFQLTMTPQAADGRPSAVWFTGNGSGFFDNTTNLPVTLAGTINSDQSWQLEAAIPWTVFGLQGPPDGDLAALVAVFDNDGEVVDGQPQQTVILGHTSAEFQRPLTWGTLELEG